MHHLISYNSFRDEDSGAQMSEEIFPKKLRWRGFILKDHFNMLLVCACHVPVTLLKHIVGICGQDAWVPYYLETHILVTYRQMHK